MPVPPKLGTKKSADKDPLADADTSFIRLLMDVPSNEVMVIVINSLLAQPSPETSIF